MARPLQNETAPTKSAADTLTKVALPLAVVALYDVAMMALVTDCRPTGCLTDNVMVSALYAGAVLNLGALLTPAAVALTRSRTRAPRE